MGQHSFAESATITHLSHSIPPLSAGISVRNKLSEYLTKIKFQYTPPSLKNSLSKIKLALYTFTKSKVKFHIEINNLYDSKTLQNVYSSSVSQPTYTKFTSVSPTIPCIYPSPYHPVNTDRK